MNSFPIPFMFRLFILIFVLSLFACDESNQIELGDNGSKTVAIVNEESIIQHQLVNELRQAKRKYRIKKNDPLPKEQWAWLKINTLNKIIQESLIKQEARRIGVKLRDSEFNTYLEKMKQGYKDESFQQALEIEEISQEQWIEKLKTQLLIKNLIQQVVNSKVAVSEKELLKYFTDHQKEFQKGEQVRALHIMVETEEEARDIIKILKKGKSFSEVAKEHSLSLEGSDGGDMGYFEKGQMPEEFDEVFDLGVKKISDIIRTPYGFHVFKVVDKIPERKMSFEESKKGIRNTLLRQAQEKAFKKWLTKVKEKSEIIINYEILEQI